MYLVTYFEHAVQIIAYWLFKTSYDKTVITGFNKFKNLLAEYAWIAGGNAQWSSITQSEVSQN